MVFDWLKSVCFGTRDQRTRSGTPDYPDPCDIMAALVGRMCEDGDAERWATFEVEDPKSTHWVQIALGEDGAFMINFDYPYQECVTTRLTNCGIDMPESWEVVFEDFGNAATISAQDGDEESVVQFADELFSKLYGNPQGYVVVGYLDG